MNKAIILDFNKSPFDAFCKTCETNVFFQNKLETQNSAYKFTVSSIEAQKVKDMYELAIQAHLFYSALGVFSFLKPRIENDSEWFIKELLTHPNLNQPLVDSVQSLFQHPDPLISQSTPRTMQAIFFTLLQKEPVVKSLKNDAQHLDAMLETQLIAPPQKETPIETHPILVRNKL